MTRLYGKQVPVILCALALMLLATACNLTSAPNQEQIDLTAQPSLTVLPTRTLFANTTITPLPQLTAQFPPTSIGIVPTFGFQFPTSTPMPVNIVILSPVPGNIVAGNVQVLGAAIHPQFLQYQLEYGPDPNPGDLWYQVGGISQTPVNNGFLGVWNTTSVQDSVYQLRLRIYLRDGTSLITVVNNIRIQNRQPIPPATATTIPRPLAAFSQDRTIGQVPLVVRFTNQSSGQITQYSWDFGDGGSSPEVNPVHTFRSPGIYTVQLRVRGPGGDSNVARQINVQSPTAPVAAFTQDRTTGESPLIVQFTDQSTGNITGRLWNFGDGSNSNQLSPSHTFNDVGTYNIILTVTGPGGTSSVTRQITVQNPTIPAPLASLVANPTNGNAPHTVQFDATDSSGQIDSYVWDFGDGSTGTGEVVTHTYAKPGTYQAVLTVVGPGGQATGTTEITVTQAPNAPTASIRADPVSGNIPLTVNFAASETTGQIDTYQWDFGDGTTAAGASVSHTFGQEGTYSVRLIITGPGGTGEATTSISATQPILPPEAAFTADPTSGEAPLDVEFTNGTSGDGLTFTWDFGDGSPQVNDRDPLHTFQNAGNFTVRLTAQGSGGTDIAEVTVNVSQAVVAVPPVAQFNANPVDGEAPLNVQFDAVQSNDITSYTWDFGDGGTGNTPSTPHTFTNPGTYTVTLTVAGSTGLTDSEQITINVSEVAVVVPPPVAQFTANPTNGAAPLPVQFDAQVTDSIVDYSWVFSDGGTANGSSVNYTFNTTGSHTAALTVTDNQGRTATQQTTIEVGETAPSPIDNSAVEQLPIIPDISGQRERDNLSVIFQNGATQGKRAGVFSVVGDDTAINTAYLTPLADPGLDLEGTDMREIVEFYRQTDVLGDGRSSFDRQRFAAGVGWLAQDLLDPNRSDPNRCSGMTPLECELSIVQPAVVFISVGYNDALNGTDPAAFRATIEQILQTVLSSGAIPVISTVQPRPDNAAQIAAINTALIEAVRNIESASNTTIPIYNLWMALNELPNSGLDVDNITLSVAPSGAGDLHDEAVTTYGANRRNRQTMRILRDLREQIFPDATP